MTKIVYTFDCSYDLAGYDAQAVLREMRRISGVESLRAYRASEGQPHYCVEVELAQDEKDLTTSAVQRFVDRHETYLSSLVGRIYQEIV